jgi:exonuclease VII large subunit
MNDKGADEKCRKGIARSNDPYFGCLGMNEPQIVCPNCSHEIKLTESLAAPLIEATRKQFRTQLEAKDADILKRELAIRTQQDQLAHDRELIEEQISARLKNERAAIAASESRKAREAAANELETQQKQVIELQQVLVDRDRNCLRRSRRRRTSYESSGS